MFPLLETLPHSKKFQNKYRFLAFEANTAVCHPAKLDFFFRVIAHSAIEYLVLIYEDDTDFCILSNAFALIWAPNDDDHHQKEFSY